MIKSQNTEEFFNTNKSVSWTAPTSGNYNTYPSTITKVNLFVPTTTNEDTYNHHPFVIEWNNKLHFMHSTTNADEENPGMYVRYCTTDLDLTNQSSYQILFPPPDDLTKDRSLGGRVEVPSGFVVVGGNLYATTDTNDRGAGTDPRPRIKVGIKARQINLNGTFGTIVWIDNADGTLTAPSPIATYPSYGFDVSLRTTIKTYLVNNPTERPDWWYSVPKTDLIYGWLDAVDNTVSGNNLAEPRIVALPQGGFMRVFREDPSTAPVRKFIEFSQYGMVWSNLQKSEIPDSPSRTMALNFNDKTVSIIGNNETGRRILFIAYSSDGLTYTAENTYDIDTENTGASFPGFGKGTGVQYPHAIQLSNDKIVCVYSVNKEDIRTALFDKP